MDKYLLDRRQFSVRCAASLALAAADTASPATTRTVKFPDGSIVPAVGQGAWHLGQDRHPPAVEEEAIRTGISLGMTLVDTSGNYGHGRSEEFLSHALTGQRDRIYLVSKVEANEVDGDGIVSNFNTNQMEDLFRVPNGNRCATNQVSYSLHNRRIERDLLPWCAQHNMPVMAYSPLGGDHNLVVNDPVPTQIGAAHSCSAAAVALAWVIRNGTVIAIPESGSPPHTKGNAAALSVTLTPQDLKTLDAAYPG